MTIGEALDTAVQRLRSQSDSARLDAEVVLAHITGLSRTTLMVHPEHPLTPAQYRRFRRSIEQRYKHQPIAYLVGQSSFLGNEFSVTPATLVPRPFTEILLEHVFTTVPPSSTDTMVDVGTGSGNIAISLALHYPNAQILGTDVSGTALRVAKKNATKLAPGRIRWYRGSLLEPLPRGKHPTHLIANLPYLTATQLREPSIRREPRIALYGGQQGLSLIRRLIQQLPDHQSITSITLELDPQQVPIVRRLLRAWTPRGSIRTLSDGRRTRGIVAQRYEQPRP